MMMLGIYAKVSQAAAAEIVQDYWNEYWAAFGIDIRPKKLSEAKPANDEDAFAISESHQAKKS